MKLFIIKYLFLLAALGCSIYVLVKQNSFTWNMLYAVGACSLIYIVISFFEFNKGPAGNMQHKRKFIYYTQGMITKKAIRIGGFMIASGILLFSGLKVLLFGIVLLAMLIGELISLTMKLKNKMYFLYFEDKSIVLVDDQIKKIYAPHIKEIEFRYNIFYLTLKNNQVHTLETERISGEQERNDFIKELLFWANTYQLPFTEEAKEKLGMK